MLMELQELRWLCVLSLFLGSLLIVLGWFSQYLLSLLQLLRKRREEEEHVSSWTQLLLTQPCQSLVGGARAVALKLRSVGRGGGPSSSEAGVKGLLTSLFSFKSFREHWKKTWISALNQQACRHGSSIQILFDSSAQLGAASTIESVTCTDQSFKSMVLQCKCSVDTVKFPVTVTQQSHAVVSIDTYQITIAPMLAQVMLSLEEVEDEGLMISWTLSKQQPSFSLSVSPNKQQRAGPEGEADLHMIKELIEDTVLSTQPAMVLNLRTSGSSPTLLCTHREENQGLHGATPLRSSATPTKKVDVDRTIMADGTIVTTVTTVQSRLRLDRSPGDSPLRSPSKVEVTEKTPTNLSDGRGSSPNPSNAAIRQLTESASRAARKTPTKRSTLIISGVSKVPLSEDTSTLSSGYAAAMDAAVHRNHFSVGPHQDVDETTPSDVSERPSVDDVESDTGSTGGYETRSLKDHKVGFLQSGTKLFFRRRRRAKEPCLSQSHEDVSNMDNNFTAVASGDRKKSGSFSRRLIKRFSFRSSGKSKGKASAKANANGGSATLDK
ncbi:phospholipid transfer protein C2CD2L [Gouania willdenowi]|uniref:phospholipid transfer protein C2CD2L n=1 Tax=Gouania willdenowi TaxID=441366 RepID=UPI001055DD05|nr:phospholipid transfer protein C2CD2L [Gouania willdenowi]